MKSNRRSIRARYNSSSARFPSALAIEAPITKPPNTSLCCRLAGERRCNEKSSNSRGRSAAPSFGPSHLFPPCPVPHLFPSLRRLTVVSEHVILDLADLGHAVVVEARDQ